MPSNLMAADLSWPLEHFEIASAYIHTNLKFQKDAYVREPPRSNGTHLYGRSVGKLQNNIYGGKSGAYFFLEELFQFLLDNGFLQTEGDQCILYKTHNDNIHTMV